LVNAFVSESMDFLYWRSLHCLDIYKNWSWSYKWWCICFSLCINNSICNDWWGRTYMHVILIRIQFKIWLHYYDVKHVIKRYQIVNMCGQNINPTPINVLIIS
jgi:hypothetical protein